jgi:hypothetical protein
MMPASFPAGRSATFHLAVFGDCIRLGAVGRISRANVGGWPLPETQVAAQHAASADAQRLLSKS